MGVEGLVQISQHRGKYLVDLGDQGLVGAKAETEFDGVIAGVNMLLPGLKHPHIRPPKAVDGLFGIANDGEGGVGDKRFEQLPLDGVGVLKFVDQKHFPALGVVVLHRRVSQGLQGMDFEVVEIQNPLLVLGLL